MARTKHAGRLAAAMMMIALGACQGSGGLANGSPEGVPIAFESIDGAPAPVRTALMGELSNAASTRKVDLVGSSAQARYRVRGYLSTETTEGETKVAYVWDVFDSQKRRAKRLAGSSPVRVASGSLTALDKETLAKLAGASMDEIAEFLSTAKAETPFQTADASTNEPAVAAQ
jgi:imidazolonepropionase-like amidohydrolase